MILFQKIKDSQLAVIVLILLGVLVFVLILWELIDPLYIHIRHLQSEVGYHYYKIFLTTSMYPHFLADSYLSSSLFFIV